MPELPEVETTLRGIEPHMIGRSVTDVIIRTPKLRWPIPAELPERLQGQIVRRLQRRAKYLLIRFDHGTLILHLGMSGSLRILPAGSTVQKHDHFELVLDDGQILRLRDPRRFGAVLWCAGDISRHPLLSQLGPEPLAAEFDGSPLHQTIRSRSAAIKLVLMDNKVVVGVGNIYANEALFRAGIRPQMAANRLSLARCRRLVTNLKEVLQEAILLGGSTLRDFVHSDGSSGYFQQNYHVYGRTGEPCRVCGSPIRQLRQGQRSSFYCTQCQR